MKYLILILSLPTQNAAARMRIWRALKSCGAAALRDGVYALPDSSGSCAAFKPIQDEAAAGDGTAYVFQAEPPPDLELAGLFSRAAEFAALSVRITRLRRELAELIRSLKDPRVQTMISITRVDTTPDLRYSKIYVSVLEEARQKEAVKGLKSAGGWLRRLHRHRLFPQRQRDRAEGL